MFVSLQEFEGSLVIIGYSKEDKRFKGEEKCVRILVMHIEQYKQRLFHLVLDKNVWQCRSKRLSDLCRKHCKNITNFDYK